MAQIKIYQLGPKDNYAYDIVDDEGNIFMTGDGFETPEEAEKWLRDLLSVLGNATWLPVNK